ncbi:MAG: MBL fold metallo-hydrolase [Spirochaetes bacterium]|nr:MBL fold metallo-hydrolase [Spirochaetota bacterium]
MNSNTFNYNFKWIGGATWILRIAGVKIACDPVLCSEGTIQDYRYFKSERMTAPHYDKKDFEDVDLWLLTHNHEDHIDSPGMEVINPDKKIIAHKSHQKLSLIKAMDDIIYMDGFKKEMQFLSIKGVDIKITSIPAIHAKRKFFSSLIGNGNGYILEIEKDKNRFAAYVTGDSVFDKKHAERYLPQKMNLVIANAGCAEIGTSLLADVIGRVTNDNNDIFRLNDFINPEVLIPVHWGTFSHYREPVTDGISSLSRNIIFIKEGDFYQHEA